MKKIDFLDALGRVDPTFIEECVTYRPARKTNVWIRRVLPLAACFAVIISAVLFINRKKDPVVIDENGFHIEDGVLLSYTGSDEEITIPESVRSIADFAFRDNKSASGIKVVRLGANVERVEVNAFAGLDNLADIIIAKNNLSFVYENGLIMTSDGTILLKYEREGENSFALPDTVRYVAAHAMQNTSLEKIEFGDSLEYIGYNAFAGNNALGAIDLPDSVTYIYEGAFSGCAAAVDGHIPENAKYDDTSFWQVPFYNTLRAGKMCPGEEIARGLVTPSEAIVKSDIGALEEQIKYILAAMRGDADYIPSEDALRAHAAASGLPDVPADMVVPESFSMDELYYEDRGWGNTGIYDVQILLDSGDYTIVMEAYGYGLFDELFWEDSVFRIVNVYFVKNPDSYSPDEVTTGHGWTAVPEYADGSWSSVIFMREDGTKVRHEMGIRGAEPPKIIFSPDGTRAAIEYLHPMGYISFTVVSLNGDKLDASSGMIYKDYLSRYWGTYVANTLEWIDEDNIAGENEHGRFVYNIFGYEIEQEERDDKLDYICTYATLDFKDDSLSDDVYGKFTLKLLESGAEVTSDCRTAKDSFFSIKRARVNSDNVYDIVVLITNYGHTGPGAREIYVFDGRTLEAIPFTPAEEAVEKSVSFKKTDVGFDVITPDAVYSVERKSDAAPIFDLPFIVDSFNYYIYENDAIECRVPVAIDAGRGVGELAIGYAYKSGELLPDKIVYYLYASEYFSLKE